MGSHSPAQPATRETPQALAARLKLPFTDWRLLARALTHRSYINEHPEALEDNERLEFLGDAVLDFLVGDWLYNHYPEKPEGELTRLRSALVRNEQLAAFASRISLGNALMMGRGEEDNGGRRRPALLCGAFEALVGAMYLNLGLDMVRSFMDRFLQDTSDLVLGAGLDQDVKSILQEHVQADGRGTPVYKTVSSSGPEHDKIFEVDVIVDGGILARGSGHSKQMAEKAAAAAALAALGIS